LEIVSIPVYAIIPIGIASRNLLQCGATPKWTFEASRCGWKIKLAPIRTSSTCVEKSTRARMTLSRTASRIPKTFRVTSTRITTAPPTMSHGFWRSGPQKTER